ncbi:MAG: MFS transporter, partial [Elusimicrobia bacterium]|nr:MFS transporter [Elusimicrobiota bacterium]
MMWAVGTKAAAMSLGVTHPSLALMIGVLVAVLALVFARPSKGRTDPTSVATGKSKTQALPGIGAAGAAALLRSVPGLMRLFAALWALMVAPLMNLAITRTREFAADMDGAKLIGNPDGLISLFEKLDSGTAGAGTGKPRPKSIWERIRRALFGSSQDMILNSAPFLFTVDPRGQMAKSLTSSELMKTAFGDAWIESKFYTHPLLSQRIERLRQIKGRAGPIVGSMGLGLDPSGLESKAVGPEHGIPPEKLRWKMDPSDLGFKTTEELEVQDLQIVGQDEALEALEFGLSMPSNNYNVYVNGMPGSGRETAVHHLLERIAQNPDHPTPPDFVAVPDLSGPGSGEKIKIFPVFAGRASILEKSLQTAFRELKKTVPTLLKGKEMENLKQNIIAEAERAIESKLEALQNKISQIKVAGLGLKVIFERTGVFIAIVDGRGNPLKQGQLEQMKDSGKVTDRDIEELNQKASQTRPEVVEVMKLNQELIKEAQKSVANLEAELVSQLIQSALAPILEEFKTEKDVVEYIRQVQEYALKHHDEFLNGDVSEKGDAPEVGALQRIKVDVLVSHGDGSGAPVVFEHNPTYENLFGTISESFMRVGPNVVEGPKTVSPGSYLKANGGFLVLHVMDVIRQPGVWPTLMSAIKSGEMEITNSPPGTLRLRSDPVRVRVKANVKVVLIGDEYILHLLRSRDPDFGEMFQAVVNFEPNMPQNKEIIKGYVAFVKKLTREQNLKELSAGAVARVLEYSSVLAGDQRKLSTEFKAPAMIIQEANYWAKKAGSSAIEKEHVDLAIQKRRDRAIRWILKRKHERVGDNVHMISMEGEKIGQLSGLVVQTYDGETYIGFPAKITAVSYGGNGNVRYTDRDAGHNRTGFSFNKAAEIVEGILKNRYAPNPKQTLPKDIRIEFSQSYRGIDGDSATFAELAVAVSELGQIPMRQDIAMTGSINLRREIQPIGGENDKIQGFYYLLKAMSKLDKPGPQGVIIPKSNKMGLMLDEEIVQAVQEGRFNVYEITTPEEGLKILSGLSMKEIDRRVNESLWGSSPGIIRAFLQRLWIAVGLILGIGQGGPTATPPAAVGGINSGRQEGPAESEKEIASVFRESPPMTFAAITPYSSQWGTWGTGNYYSAGDNSSAPHAEQAHPPPRHWRVLPNPEDNKMYWLYVIGQAILNLGVQFNQVALPGFGIKSPLGLGLVRFGYSSSQAVSSLSTGPWVDRISNRKALVWTSFLQGMVVLLIPIFFFLAPNFTLFMNVSLFMGLLFLVMLFRAFFVIFGGNAGQAAFTKILQNSGEKHYVRANAIYQIVMGVVGVGGAYAAGNLISWLNQSVQTTNGPGGSALAFVAYTLLAVASVYVLRLLKSRSLSRPDVTKEKNESWLRILRQGLKESPEGFRMMKAKPFIWPSLLFAVLEMLALDSFIFLILPKLVSGGPTNLGLVMAMYPLGNLVGNILMGFFSGKGGLNKQGRYTYWAVVLSALPLIGLLLPSLGYLVPFGVWGVAGLVLLSNVLIT